MSEGANAAGQGCEGAVPPVDVVRAASACNDGSRSTDAGAGTYFTPAGPKMADADYRTSKFHIPTMRASEPAPWEYDASTCFEAGYLVEKNAGWRQVRPVIGADACTGCLTCYMYCPDGAIRKTHAEGAAVFVDYDFCKGCGICRTVCRFDAIVMASEVESLAAETMVSACPGAAGDADSGKSDMPLPDAEPGSAGDAVTPSAPVTEGGAR